MTQAFSGHGESDFEALYRQNVALRREVDHLSTLREIGLAISGSLEKAETMRLIAEVVQGALDVQRLTIYEFDSDRDALCPTVAKYGEDLITAERLEEDRVTRRKSSLWEVFDHPQGAPGGRAACPRGLCAAGRQIRNLGRHGARGSPGRRPLY